MWKGIMTAKFYFILLFVLLVGIQALPAQSPDYRLLLENQIRAFNEKDLNTLVENVTDDFVWFYVTEYALAEEVRGKVAFKEAMEDYFRNYDDTKTSMYGITQSGNFISFKETTNWGNGQDTQSSIAVYQFENNKIKKVWYFPSHKENKQSLSNLQIMDTTKNEIRMERMFQVPLTTLWEAWIDPEQVGSWFALKAHIVPERGGAYELFWRPDDPEHDSTIGCRITHIEPKRYLAFTWRGPDQLSSIMNEGNPPPPPTHVTVIFDEQTKGSNVRVIHNGFGEGEEWQKALKWHETAWNNVLENLDAYLAGHPLPHPWDRTID